MRSLLTLAGLASLALAHPGPEANSASASHFPNSNPFLGKNYFANANYASELNTTLHTFLAQNDTLNAARIRTVQKLGTFTWITSVSSLELLNQTIIEARAEQEKTRKLQIVELVLFNIPDRDCPKGQSSGEFTLTSNGLELYEHTFVDPYAAALKAAPDLTFSVIVEPDTLGNVITNQHIPFCAAAAPGYEQGIAYAIANLQAPNIALYMDAAHGGWLGWDNDLPLAAAEFSKVIALARNYSTTPLAPRIRGFSIDVSNFNPYIANPRANYTQGSNSYDELHYAESLEPYLTNVSLPAKFIIDQGRSGLQNTRSSWGGEWCNVKAGFGIPPTTATNSTLVDSIVWAKPGGESDGTCGPTINGVGAPPIGQWWDAYAQELVKNANPPITPTFSPVDFHRREF